MPSRNCAGAIMCGDLIYLARPARGNFETKRSDVDLIVQFAQSGYAGYADTFLDFAEALDRVLGRKVDLLTERMIRNPHFRDAVEATRQSIYDERSESLKRAEDAKRAHLTFRNRLDRFRWGIAERCKKVAVG